MGGEQALGQNHLDTTIGCEVEQAVGVDRLPRLCVLEVEVQPGPGRYPVTCRVIARACLRPPPYLSPR